MKRIAIIGGGISGLTAAYECEKLGLDWHLYEASDRLGGIIETTRIATPKGEYILEGGPDGWVTEKPWLRDLAIELGLENELIHSNDATRKTYILRDGKLEAIPDRMRMMVPEDLTALDNSPLFSAEAKAAYASELTRAHELRATALAPAHDESVASFVERHFGQEVLVTLAAPLLSGVFGGDVHKLSVQAVMPQFVAMERQHGSLIAALQSKQHSGNPAPIFTSLRRGLASLVEALAAKLPAECIHLRSFAHPYPYDRTHWLVGTGESVTLSRSGDNADKTFAHIVLAASLDSTYRMLDDEGAQALLPSDASSAILAAMAWPAELARTFAIPEGFGFLVPPQSPTASAERQTVEPHFPGSSTPPLLACTFVDQKFPYRAPAGARVLRGFFGGASAEALRLATDAEIVAASLDQLRHILGPVPAPEHTHVRRLPRSLPQYEVGHLDRIAELDRRVAAVPGLHLLGNAYRGVGLPDLIRDARALAHRLQS